MSCTEISVNPFGFNKDLIFDVYSDVQPRGGYHALTINWTSGGIASMESGNWPLNTPIVGAAGDELYNKLQAHPQAPLTFSITLAPAHAANSAIRVYVDPKADSGHRIPWETLKAQNGFVSTGLRVPVVRVAKNLRKRDDGIIVDRTLRVVVVLGALGINCSAEWNELYAALAAWPYSFDVSVITYDVNLKASIDNLPEAQPGGSKPAPGVVRIVRADMILDRADTLMQYISGKSPHICHFFCHGTSDANGQLEVAHRGTAVAGDLPVYLSRFDVAKVANSAWLIVLNACKSAALAAPPPQPAPLAGPASAGTGAIRAATFASALIAEGVPFVVGMRERIASNIVPKFTRAFYVEALAILAACAGIKGQSSVDICPAIIAGQVAICNHFGNPALASLVQPDWTFPVFYTREEPFSILSVDSNAVASYTDAVIVQAEIRELKNILATGIDPSIRNEIVNRIADLEARLGLKKV